MSIPDPRHFLGNFRESDLPLLEKLRLVAKNNAIKIKNGTSCCGNHVEPGCCVGPDGSGSDPHDHDHDH
jgi:hypothetical protein